jgi:dihydropteroate synthase
MTCNALVVASTSFPSRAGDRRRLGLPSLRSDAAVRTVRLEAVSGRIARALCGLMAASGGTAHGAPGGRGRATVVLLQGDGRQFHDFLEGAARNAATRAAAAEVREVLLRSSTRPRVLALARGRLTFGGRTLVMGVLNVTPDSFSDGGRHDERRAAIERALQMAREGAALVDIGGESTRPGAKPVPLVEELRRVMPVLEGVVAAFRSAGGDRPIVSVDTRKAEVARRAARAGADLINDVSGLTFDPAMAAAVADSGLPVVIQHTRGTPLTMQRAPRYAHLLPDIAAFLRAQIDRAVRAGVREDRILIDPGIGFGKRRRDNLAILRHLRVLSSLGRPILVGASRKSFLEGTSDGPPEGRLASSLAAEALAIQGGADIIRAHDVREAVRVASLCDAVLRDSAP